MYVYAFVIDYPFLFITIRSNRGQFERLFLDPMQSYTWCIRMFPEPDHEITAPFSDNYAQTNITAEVTPEGVPELQLDPTILSILGDEPAKEERFSAAIHRDIANRWSDILVSGLKEDIKKDLLKNCDVPENLKLALPPLLNPEIKAAVNENVVRRDAILQEKQKHLACAITCLSELMTLTINSAETSDFNRQSLQLLSNTGRLLCHMHYSETCSRKNFLLSCLNKEVKDNIKDLKRDQLLFGTDLSEKLKAMKAISKTGVDLRPSSAKTKSQPRGKQAEPSTSKTLNWRGPPPPTPRGGFPRPSSTAGGRKQQAARPREAARRDQRPRGRTTRR